MAILARVAARSGARIDLEAALAEAVASGPRVDRDGDPIIDHRWPDGIDRRAASIIGEHAEFMGMHVSQMTTCRPSIGRCIVVMAESMNGGHGNGDARLVLDIDLDRRADRARHLVTPTFEFHDLWREHTQAYASVLREILRCYIGVGTGLPHVRYDGGRFEFSHARYPGQNEWHIASVWRRGSWTTVGFGSRVLIDR